MKKVIKPYVFLIGVFISANAAAAIDFSLTVICEYQKGQFLSIEKSESFKNSNVMKWTFNGLKSKKPIFVAGGDSGEVIAVPMTNGVIIYLPSSLGTSTFTIWSTGETFWGKQANILGNANSQQFIGVCSN